jgi:hypothetical protein
MNQEEGIGRTKKKVEGGSRIPLEEEVADSKRR